MVEVESLIEKLQESLASSLAVSLADDRDRIPNRKNIRNPSRKID
jgi:hypothetical protein